MVRDLFQLNTLYKRIFLGSLGLFIVLCGTYGIFLKQTVASVVERRALEAQRAELAANVSVLEAAYIREGNAITREKAAQLGFVGVTAERFVSRAGNPAFSFEYSNED
ncbi:MAG: hypothetical protein KBD16_01670 [Candidatus Pacebacteria bacterium]|nr:hypothetical protein [Candidatus Paceibacterota bacterium]